MSVLRIASQQVVVHPTLRPLDGPMFIPLAARGKNPIQQNWPHRGVVWNDPALQKHIASGGNVGFLCGNGFVVLDVDDIKALDISAKLPPTLIIVTGTGKPHFYYRCPLNKKYILRTPDGKRIGELQAKGSQVVAPPSVHPNGRQYVVKELRPPAEVSEEEMLETISPFVKSVRDNSNEETCYPMAQSPRKPSDFAREPLVAFLLEHKIPDGTGRHAVLAKNLGALMVLCGLSKNQRLRWGDILARSCPGKPANQLTNWVRWFQKKQGNGEAVVFDELEVADWINRVAEVVE